MDPLTKNAGALIQPRLPRWRRAGSAYVIAGEIDRAVASFVRRLARYAARIFQGARAGDLPIEMLAHFELAINFGTVPPTLLSLAPTRSSNSARQFPVGVTSVAVCDRWLAIDFCYALFAAEVVRRCKMSRRANSGRSCRIIGSEDSRALV